jgi:hypothetical protein
MPHSSSSIPAAPIHGEESSVQNVRAKALRIRTEGLNWTAVAPVATRESVGRIVSLSTGRLGVLSPRDARGKRRPLGVVGSPTDAQQRIADFKHRKLIADFVARLSGLGGE